MMFCKVNAVTVNKTENKKPKFTTAKPKTKEVVKKTRTKPAEEDATKE